MTAGHSVPEAAKAPDILEALARGQYFGLWNELGHHAEYQARRTNAHTLRSIPTLASHPLIRVPLVWDTARPSSRRASPRRSPFGTAAKQLWSCAICPPRTWRLVLLLLRGRERQRPRQRRHTDRPKRSDAMFQQTLQQLVHLTAGAPEPLDCRTSTTRYEKTPPERGLRHHLRRETPKGG